MQIRIIATYYNAFSKRKMYKCIQKQVSSLFELFKALLGYKI